MLGSKKEKNKKEKNPKHSRSLQLGTVSVLQHTFSTQWGSLQLCLCLYFLLAWGLTTSQIKSLEPSQVFSECAPWPWHEHGFLDSQECMEAFQKSLLSFFFPGFQHVCCLPQLQSFATADSSWFICFKCFKQKYQSHFSVLWNSKKERISCLVKWRQAFCVNSSGSHPKSQNIQPQFFENKDCCAPSNTRNSH